MTAVIALAAGVLFGFGLLLSGMTNPANVTAFLDVTGAWQPSLALTMAAAVAIALPAFAFVRIRGRSLRGISVPPIDRLRVDGSLVLGSAVFGAGWGLSGICPGPGLMLLVSGDSRAFLFTAGVAFGVFAAGAIARRDSGATPGAASPPVPPA
jgi:uncharacterized membrane protein YedE/YeeE